MADELTIKVSAKLDESSVSGIQSQLDGLSKNNKNKIQIQVDNRAVTDSIKSIQNSLNQLTSKPYRIELQIDQSIIRNINSITNSLNQAVNNVQRSMGQQLSNIRTSPVSGNYTGVSKVIQRGKVDEINGFEATSEIEKRNLALGETLTIYKELKKEEDDEIGRMEETSRQYETNYELQAKAAAKSHEQAIQEEAKYRAYIEKENAKAQKEQEALARQQQQQQAKVQKDRERNSSMYAGMFQQIDTKEQKERDRAAKEEQKRQEDYTKLHIQARQKQAKEDERLAKEEQKRNDTYDKLFAEAERKRLQQEADAKKASEQQYLSDLKKNSKQLEFEQKTSANAQSLIANAQNELKLLEKSTFSGSKALTGDYADKAHAEIAKVSEEFDKLKEAAGKSFSDAMGVSKDGLTASLKNLGAELDKLKGLQYPADKLAAKDVDTLKLDYGNKIQEFREQLKGAGLETSDFATKLGDLEKNLQTVGKVDGSGTVWADWKAQFESLQASYEKFQASASGKGLKLAESIDIKQLGQVQDLIATLNNSTISGAGTEALKEELYSLETEYSNLMAQLQSGNLTTDQFNALSNGVKELDDRLKQAASSAKVLQDGFKNEQSIHKFQNNVDGLRNNFEKLERTYANIIENNPEIAAKFEQLRAMFEQGQVDPINYAQVASDVSSLGKACSNAAGEASGLRGALEGAFGGVGQYLARFTSAFYIINKSIQTVKSMVNEVTQLDTSLMELQKVTTLSGDSLAQFTDNAYKTGKEVGRTGKDVIDAVTTFSRAGYNLEESNQLAKAALTMTNVGVDIPSTEAAASDMISILKAFDKQADESMQVIDELYNVANKEPLDFGNITQMLVTAGGTLAQTNTSLEETMGLLTGGFATLRDTSVANGLIMISQRLRGVKEDGEAIEEEGFMPKLKKAFGDVGISIEDQNGELRSTYDILNDLAGVWDQLSSKQRQYLGEKAAGNRQVKTLNAIMSNWDVVQDTIQKANEATGEATKGNEKYLDSIEGRITQFKSAFSDLARTTIDSDFVKGIVGFGTGVLNVTKDLGGLVPVLTTISSIIFALKGAKILEGLKGIGLAIKGIFSLTSGITSALAGGAGLIGLVASLAAIVIRINDAKKSFATLKTTADQSKENVNSQKTTIENLNTELKNTQDLIADLEGKENLTVVEEAELNRLRDVNKELERSIQLEEAKLLVEQRSANKSTAEAINALYNGETGNIDYSSIDSKKQTASVSKIPNFIDFYSRYSNELAQSPGYIKETQNYLDEVLNAYNTIYPVQQKSIDSQSEVLDLEEKISKAREQDPDSIKALNSELEAAEARRDYYEVELQGRLAVLNDFETKASQLIGDIPEIVDPKTDSERTIQSMQNMLKMVQDAIIQTSIDTPQKASDYLLSVYEEEANAVKEIVEKEGKITFEELSSKFPKLLSAFEQFGERFGFSAENIAQHLTEVFGGTNEEGIVSNKFASIEELITNNYLASDSYKTLSTAMTEQQKSGAISMETYQKLIAVDKQLANVLTLTANGYALNSDAVNEYVQAKADEQKIQAMLSYDEQQQKLKELKKRYEDLSNGLIEVDDLQTEIANNQSAQKAAEQNMEALEAYIREINSATSALTRFKAAQSSANEDANFQDSKKVYDVIKEGNKTGKRNTDDFKTAVDYVLGDNWRENLSEFGGSVEEAYKLAEQKSKRYSGQKDEKTAVDNFMKDVGKTGLGTYDSKTGSLELNEGVTLGELSEKMKVSKEYLTDMFKLLNTYAGEGEGFFFPEFFTDDDKKQLEERKKALEENENSQEQVGNTIEDINKKIAKAEEEGNKEEVKRLEGQKEGLEEAQKVLEQQHTDLEAGAPITPDVDTMSLEDAKKKIDELSETIRTLQGAGISIPVYLPPALDVLLNKFPGLINQLEEPTTIKVEEEGSEETSAKLTQVKKDAEDIPDNTTTKVEEQGATETTNKLSDVGSAAEDVKDDVNVNVKEEGAEEAKEKIQGVSDGPYDPASIGAEADNASLSSVGKELDDLAKDRTVTYKPQIPEMPVPIDVPLDDSDGASREPSTGRTKTADEKRSEEEWNNWFDWFDGTYRNGGKTEQSVEVGVEASQESGEQIVEQVQKDINKEKVDFDPELQVDEWGLFGDNGENKTVDVQTEAANPEEPIQQVQEAASGTPVELQFDFGDLTQLGSAIQSLIGSAEGAGVGDTSEGAGAISNLRQAYVELSKAMEKTKDLEVGDVSGAEQAASEIQNAANNFTTAYNTLSTMTSSLTVDPIEFDADTSKAVKKVQAIGEKGVTVKVDGNTSSLASAIDSYNNRTITVNIQTNEIGGNAKGTKNAAPGPSLVDEEGAELIEHVNRGTYELGTNNGPRMTKLEKGDIVHTASETKRILSRVSKIGGFFKNGLNQAKSVLTGGAFRFAQDAGIGGKVTIKPKKPKKPSSKKSSSSSKKSSKSSSTNMKKLQEWFEKLFDWAEIRLERLQTITDEWIYKAGQAIGYAAQNTQLANAMKSVENQIKDTTAAYNLYIAQADKVAKKTKLSADIINRIQNGTIEISSYSKDTQAKIKQYQTFYDKAIACKEALQDLNEQQKELAKTRLDNIISHYTNRVNVYENIIKQREAQMNLAEAQGREQFASDYNTSITATNNKLNTLVQERAALNNEFNSLVAKGYIKKDSDEWFEYSEKIRDLDTEIITVKNDIIDLHDAANKVALTKLSYQLDQLANSASHIDEMINLHSAQAIDEYAENFKTLIDNGMDQIKNLQAQNAEYRKQQQGLDKMSAKYQELEQSIQSNITAINQMKVSQEGWNDSVYDIQIGKINDFKDQLSKTNELYERQKSLQEAIQELEKARSQRTQRVFHEGIGFTYEADQEAVKDAQESLEDVIQDELMSKMDDLIDALEEQKDNNNIYDANGNLLGTQYVIPQLDNLSEILSNYYSNPNNAPSVDAIRKLFMDELVSNSNTSNSNQASINIGDIIIQEAENGNDLANAIINQLPNALLQALYKKS